MEGSYSSWLNDASEGHQYLDSANFQLLSVGILDSTRRHRLAIVDVSTFKIRKAS